LFAPSIGKAIRADNKLLELLIEEALSGKINPANAAATFADANSLECLKKYDKGNVTAEVVNHFRPV